MSHPLRVLIVDDSEADATLLQHALRRGGYEITCEVVDTPAAMRAALESQAWDVITSDHAMPRFNAPAALALAKEICPDVPFVIVSGEIDLNLAVSLMRDGAQDYIQKRELARLVSAVDREIREVELRHARQRADAALIESEEQYRLLFQSMDSGFALHEIICDAQGVPCDYRFLEINPAFEKLTGLKAAALIGHTNMEMLPGTEKAWIERYGKVALTGEAAHFEDYSNELGKYYEVTAYSPRQGQFAVIFRDITEQKRAEEILKASEERYRFSLEVTGQIGWSTPPDGIVEDMPLWRLYSGQSVEEVQGWKWLDAVHPDDRDSAFKAWSSAAAQKRTYQTEYRIRRADGVYRHFMVRGIPLFNADGTCREWTGTCIDITERKQVEDALRESEAKHKSMIANISDVIAIMAGDGTLKYKSPNIEKWFGWQPDDLVGTDGWATVHPDDLERIQKEFWMLLEKDNAQKTVEYRYLCKDGSYKLIELTAVNLTNDPNIHGVLMNYHDITERKQAEAALRESEAGALRSESRLKIAQSVAHVGDWVWNIKDKQVEWSDEMYGIFGIKKNSYTGRLGDAIAQVIHPDDLYIVQPANAAAFAEKKPVEYRILWPDGSIRNIVAETGDAILDGSGTPIYLTGTCQDITERKRAEEDLRLGQQQYRDMFESNTAIKLLIDPIDGAIVKANQAAAEFYGWSTNLLETMKISQINTLTPEQIKAEMRHAASMERTYFEFSHRLASGEVRDVEVHSSPMESDRRKLLFSIIHDITERKQAEEELKKRINEISLLYRASQNIGRNLDLDRLLETFHQQIAGIMACDTFFVSTYAEQEQLIRCVYANSENSRLDVSGFPAIPLEPEGKGTQSQVIRSGRAWMINDHQAEVKKRQTRYYIDQNGAVEKFEDVSEDEDITRSAIILPLLFKEKVLGVIQIFSYRLNAYSQENLNIAEALVAQFTIAYNNATLYSDAQRMIAERNQAEEEIRQLNADLEQRVAERTAQLTAANRELEAFSYSVSHDLRAPLRSLDGFSKVLLEDYAGQLDEPGKQYLTRIQEASQRMDQLINDLLKLSHITRADFTRQSVDLSALATHIAVELKAQSPDRCLEFEIAADMIVLGDGNLLKIVLENLLNNACKFTGRCPQAIIQVGRLEQDGQWVYFVRDNGAGFDMNYANKLFAAFQRLHSEKEFPGTGVGLATVQRIIHRHGGRVWAEGVVNQGATFYFTMI
jgi:PAS domain S-box-containing protein